MMRNQTDESSSMNIEQLNQVAMNVVEAFCGIFARPVELILRPWHGTRYFAVPVIFFSSALMLLLPMFSAAATGVTHMIPFTHFAPPVGLYDIGSFSALYFLLSFVHGFRLYRRMLDPSREPHSEYEGDPLPFFQLIPFARSFWFTRIVLEPLFVFATAIALQQIFLIQSGLAAYLEFAALALAMKSFIGWYRNWEFIRKILDARFAGPILGKLMNDQASEDELASIHLASFPKNLSPELRQATAAHIARVYSPGTPTPQSPKGDSYEAH
jgi:hypothetical protein